MTIDDLDGADGGDPWDAMTSWRHGRATIDDLAAVLAANVGDLDNSDDEVRWDVEFFDRWWDEISDDLADFGFGPADYDTLLASLVPRLDRRYLRAAPPDATTRIDVACVPRPAGRVYLDVDSAYSPICLQRDQANTVGLIRGPELRIDQPPDTGWTWEMCSLGLGPTPYPSS